MATISVFCHKNGWVLIDGYSAGRFEGETLIVNVTTHPVLLAISCEHNGVDGGLIVSDSNGFVTDNNWKCSTSPGGFWRTHWCDDRSWQNAVELGRNVDTPNGWDYKDGFADNANWVWGENPISTRRPRYYFRRILGECPASISPPGRVEVRFSSCSELI